MARTLLDKTPSVNEYANMLTTAGVLRVLNRHARREGSQSALAAKIQVSRAFLNDIINRKREPSGKVLEFLGLEKKIFYTKKENGAQN